ncbi:GAF domain-containing protein [Motiliproteus sp. SC1-56]|uniref:GAF domain-containing protein n=1 Tax=Motiliproteus sp. SC1-56 TaxID=2799565 RepID=UPI001A8C83AD|nr:GAF domain-containing protein [Motiliproteus sp. SC1-56]
MMTDSQEVKDEGAFDNESYNFVAELIDLSSFLDRQESLESSLKELTTMVARLLRVKNCSIMLLKRDAVDASSQPRLRVLAHHGYLPEEAYQEATKLSEGISGSVASTGEPLLIAEIRHSPHAIAARRPVQAGDDGFISCPLMINDEVVGVLNVSTPVDGRTLSESDLETVSVIAVMVSKSIQVFQLQHLLRSNFVQLALARESHLSPQCTLGEITRNGDRMAKTLAKSFFKEMQNTGFGSDHIVKAATEIISLISSDLADKRRNKE